MAQDNEPNPKPVIHENVVYPDETSLAAVFERVAGQAPPLSDDPDDSDKLTDFTEQADETRELEKEELVYGDVFNNLNELIEACRDSEYGFRECADNSQADNLTELLNRYADETRANLEELQVFAREMGGQAEGTGSVIGALHRGWVSLRGTLTGYSPDSMLAECQSGQETLLAAYNTAQQQNLPEEILDVVIRQAEGVLKNHTRIKELRDSLQAED